MKAIMINKVPILFIVFLFCVVVCSRKHTHSLTISLQQNNSGLINKNDKSATSDNGCAYNNGMSLVFNGTFY